MKANFARLSVNVVGKPRFSVMEGRDYVVLPVIILMEGVHHGSGGPILYTLEDMAKFCPAWNHKPVVVNHPKKGGDFVSADDPAILSTTKVGILMGNHISGKGQQAEAWLEQARLKEVDSRILDRINEGLVIEVSTGLFTDNEEDPGEWEGEAYEGIARNYRPDHLALLPDTVGACSVQDGCGLFTAQQAMTVNTAKKVKKELDSLLSNEMSHAEIWSSLYEKIQPPPTEYSYIDDVYDDYFIYCTGDCHYRQDYKTTKDGVELVGDPVEVERKVVYNSNQKDKTMKTNCECGKEIKTLADQLIAANKGWLEEDREYLQKQDEKMLKKFVAMQATVTSEEEETNEEEEVEDEVTEIDANKDKKKKKKPEAYEKPKANKKLSVKEFIDNSPPEIQEMLQNGLRAQAAERKRYTDIILSNEENQFSEDELATMKPDMLKKLASLAVQNNQKEAGPELVDLFSYVGQVGAPNMNNSSNKEEHLPLPVMNFDSKK